MYPAAAAALLHAWLQTKVGHALPWGFVGTALALAVVRLWAWRAGEVAPSPRRAGTVQSK